MDHKITDSHDPIRAAEICIPCEDLTQMLAFFTGDLGFRVDLIFPADAPCIAVVSGHGVTLRLERSEATGPVGAVLRLHGDEGTRRLTAPNGMRIEFVDDAAASVLPGKTVNPEWVLTRGGSDGWSAGRAGMLYRDLIPSRLGGRFIASHIRIPDGGEVPDYVHFHKVRFQMIFCRTGWVRVVYEDQGEPFVLHAGDCVLQPPEIRHRVLESSPGLEVVEVGCPAVHETWADHALDLPTTSIRHDRKYAGQRFVRYEAAGASWDPSEFGGFESSDTGIAAATAGLAGVRVLRAQRDVNNTTTPVASAEEFHFLFVLTGEVRVEGDAIGDHILSEGDSCVLPGGITYSMRAARGAELLQVKLPA